MTPAISYTDAVSFPVVEAENCTAVMTFDDDFAIAGFRKYAG
jgi:predicted nucleic acid-binding protein